ncbi:MAG TPA: hypothetical protein V6D17_11390 [Candidatus Obscuribacterales bacterium]
MDILLYCALGAVICALWFLAQMKLFDWAGEKETFVAWLVSRASLVLLSAAITAVMFTAFITVYLMVMKAMFGI